MVNWKYVKIGDVCTVERGGSPRPIDKFITDDPNGINWIKIGDTDDSMYITKTAQKIIPEGMKKSRYVQPGDFLLSNSMSFGRPYILKIDGCIHDGWLVLRDNNGIFDKRFLYYYLSSPSTYQKFKNMAVGGVVNNLNSEMVRGVTVPVPTMEEQLNIVSALDKVTELIALRKEQLAKLDQLVKSRFIELFGSVEDNRFGIKTVKIKDACELINGKAFKPEDWSDKGLPIVRIQNLNNEQAPFNYFEGEIKEQYLIDTGELLFSWSGTPGTSFGAFFWNRGKAVLNQHIFRVKPKLKFNLFFLQFALNGRIDFIISKAHGGVGLQHITKKELDEVELLLPSVEQQNQFAAFVEQTDKSKLAIQASLDKLELLKKSLMQQYFG